MRNAIKVFLLGMVVLISSTNSFAQASASATANTTATIVTPISITQTTDLEFGNVAVSASSAGTVVMGTNSSRSTTGGVTLPNVTGTTTAAAFTIAGTATYTYAITLPTSVVIDDDATHNMTVNTFVSDPTPTGTLDGSGNQTLSVGATLNVDAGQSAGTYASDTDFEVTVVYN